MDYGKAIRVARATKGMTQKQLASLVDVNPSFISRIEAGQRSPSIETLEDLAQGLSIPLHLLILLGSESEDLKGISQTQGEQLAQHLLEMVLQDQ